MWRRVFLSVFALGSTLAFAAEPPPAQGQKLLPNDFVAVVGDSITEQKIYCRYIELYLLMCKPQPNLRTMQFGWNGEKSWGFLQKMPNEAMRFDPNVVTICFGMNDGGYVEPGFPPDYNRYRTSLHAIVQNFKKDGVRFIVLGSPGVVDSQTFWGGAERAGRYNPVLGKLKDIAREVAAKEGVAFANIHDPMNDVMVKAKAKFGKQYALAGHDDGVHPDENGHLVMAWSFLKALGCDGNIGTIMYDLTANAAIATEGHRVISANNGSIELESTRYPFCFFGDPKSPKSPKGILEFLPFNEDLNRYRLVVRNVPTGSKVRVTWGAASREYSAEQVTNGVNLAADFFDNPFSAAFLRVEEAVKAQQDFETPLIKRLYHELNDFETFLPEEKARMEDIKLAGQRKAKELFDRAASSVVPVKHTLHIELVK